MLALLALTASPRTRGRPTTFDPEIGAEIVRAVRAGNYFSTACAAAGIPLSTAKDWRSRGRDGDPRYADFAAQVDQASALTEVDALAKLGQGGPDWRAHAWFLERRFPRRWGRRGREPLPLRPSKPLCELTDEDLARYAAEVDAWG